MFFSKTGNSVIVADLDLPDSSGSETALQDPGFFRLSLVSSNLRQQQEAQGQEKSCHRLLLLYCVYRQAADRLPDMIQKIKASLPVQVVCSIEAVEANAALEDCP